MGGAKGRPNQNHGFSPVAVLGSFPLHHLLAKAAGYFSVQLLLTFIDDRQIDVAERIATARFLDLDELCELVTVAYLPQDIVGASKRSEAPMRNSLNVVNLDRVRKRAPKPAEEAIVAISTVTIRLYYAGSYLEWLGHRAATQVCASLE